MGENFQCVVFNLNAPFDATNKLSLWEDIFSFHSHYIMSWCCAGDFNTIRCLEERTRCTHSGLGMTKFNDFIDLCELTDLPLVGKKFTRYRSNYKCSCINRL
ncbi:Uncharacterized protein TCM_024649 [Theobroma cacao]|uniref:Endonuclease/exonuclease/phosphatase domain-containing protein n=1 Tax=Theobroma cacao TaxID=3641 RepID=A0A061F410_THECC|nr:Uncharacterized protein TCM_024649 [Theobroma cacao]